MVQPMKPFAYWVCLLLLRATTIGAENCERLQSGLSYSQEEAPRDLSLLPHVIARVNQVLEGVTNVQVDWHGGDFHSRVGEHTVQCRVTRLAFVVPDQSDQAFEDETGRMVVEQCFHVHLTITDTNECTLKHGHPMRHKCHEPSICVNTVGSYECICPKLDDNVKISSRTADDEFWRLLQQEERSAWEVSFGSPSKTTCPSSVTTFGCCDALAHTDDGSACRADFRCPVNPCGTASLNDCAKSAICKKTESPDSVPNYSCQCPEGLMGSGRRCRPGVDPKPEPKVMFDGVTPTDETIKNDFYCGCTRPLVDACAGFPPCKGKHEVCALVDNNVPECRCKPGYVMHEHYGCVDESPPKLRLNNDPQGDGVLRLKQGDFYREYAVDILDQNAEDYLRSLKVAYSHPLPQGCLTQMGEFHVDYTVATPWTSPSHVSITRQVVIGDIDECSIDREEFMKTCPELIPKCDTAAGARCMNTRGSYTCKCPNFTSGDGFQRGIDFSDRLTPEGFKGGTSCVDTGLPVIHLKGPNPKIFRVCECRGLSGVMGAQRASSDLSETQKQNYAKDIAQMIQATAGAELCASVSNPNPQPHECVEAYDDTHLGRVELSHKVIVGDPVQKSPNHWSVPYDVVDEAGNSAETVWRDIVVEELNLNDIETSIRDEVKQEMQAEKEEAIQQALAIERSNTRPQMSRERVEKARECQCPSCENTVPVSKEFDEYCNPGSKIIQGLIWLESFVSPMAAQAFLITSTAILAYMIVYFMWQSIFTTQHRSRRSAEFDANSEDRIRAIQNGIGYVANQETDRTLSGTETRSMFDRSPHKSPTLGTPRIPRSSIFLNGDDGRTGTSQLNGHTKSQSEVFYDTPTKITPSKRGDGVHRRSPYDYQT